MTSRLDWERAKRRVPKPKRENVPTRRDATSKQLAYLKRLRREAGVSENRPYPTTTYLVSREIDDLKRRRV